MAKNTLREWDVTASNNADVGGISLAEGMNPAFVNDAMREMMGQVRRDVRLFDTRAVVASSSIGSHVDFVRTAGYTDPGDGGGGLYKKASSEPGHEGKVQSSDGAWWELSGGANPRQFGAAGDYDTDDTAAIEAWLAYFAATGRPLYDDGGVYRLTDSVEWPSGLILRGAGMNALSPYPLENAEKAKMRPGFKHLLTGTVFILSGTATGSFTTVRSDKFSAFSYIFAYRHYEPFNIRGINIVQDMDIYDTGGTITTAATDNRADVDAGLVIQSTLSKAEGVNIFGYFPVQALVIHNEFEEPTSSDLDDTDYNTFRACRFTSGRAIIGHDTAAGESAHGNTGNLFSDCETYDQGHHDRDNADYTVNAVFIDGNLTSSLGIRGHHTVGGNIRGFANDLVKLDHSQDISFIGVVWENPARGGVTNADATGKIVGTANTGNVTLVGGAQGNTLGVHELMAAAGGKVIAIGTGGMRNIEIGESGNCIALIPDAATGDSIVQLATDLSSITNGWTIRRDGSDSDSLDLRYNGTALANLSTAGLLTSLVTSVTRFRFPSFGTALTISAGVVTITQSAHQIRTEGAAASDDLDTINGGVEGDILILRAALNGEDVVAKDGTGNLRLAGDFTLTHPQDRLMLHFDGTNWCEMSRADNTV